jgi:oligo-1,6-glucosidase
VREEIYDMMAWWLDKGIDGFRVDAITHIKKAPGFPDMPNPDGKRYVPSFRYHLNQPGIHEFLQEMKQNVLNKYDIMTVGEAPGVPPEEALLYVGEESGAFNMLFQFEHMEVDAGPDGKFFVKPWSLVEFKKIMTKWQKGMESKGWNSLYLENHDQPRSVSNFGNDQEYHAESAKMLATCLHMLQGTPYVYQGQEIGMTNVQFESIDDYRDVSILNYYRESLQEGKDPEQLMRAIWSKGRDNARTPMQWDNSGNAGFTTGTPWIQVNPNYRDINVKKALANTDSIFYYYQQLIRLRRQHPIVVYGRYDLLLDNHEQIFAYTRTLGAEQLLVILNFSEETPVFELPEGIVYSSKQLWIGNYPVNEQEDIRSIRLKPYEARVYRLEA